MQTAITSAARSLRQERDTALSVPSATASRQPTPEYLYLMECSPDVFRLTIYSSTRRDSSLDSPNIGVIAGLVFLLPVAETAASVADHRDAPDRALRKRQVLIHY